MRTLMRCSSSEAADKVRKMWSYRLYRYSSPSTSALVYGVGRADVTMPYFSPRDLARGVYTAIEAGTDLPPLPNTPEVAQALLVFHPEDNKENHWEADEDQAYEISDEEQGRMVEGRKAQPQTASSEGEEDRLLPGQRVTSAPPTQRSKVSSFLLLEALRRRRLDAVHQLHDVCPQLLESLPIFIALGPQPGAGQSVAGPASSPVSCWTSFSHAGATRATWDLPPAHKTSPLLDAAVENRALLVFVLRNHPDLRQSAAAVPGPAKPSCHTKNTRSTDGREQVRADALEHRALYSKGEVWMETMDKDTQNEFVSQLPPPDPGGPVAVCLHQGVPEVLQYLLYKYVWQHFMLEDVLLLPQNSQVPDLEGRTGGAECWFLHCTALMGCPLLLHQVLKGAYGTPPRRRYAAPAAKITGGSGSPGRRKASQSDADNCQQMSAPSRSDQLTNEGPCPFPESVDKGEKPVARAQEAKQSPNRRVDESEVMDDEKAEVGGREVVQMEDAICQKTNQKAKGGGAREKKGCEAGWGRCRPNPNALLPVSLPVMDRWISRCMHVRVTPLHLACWRCDAASIRVLLQHGADVNAVAEEVEVCAEAEKSSSSHSGRALSGSGGSGGSGPTINSPHSSASNLALNLLPSDQQTFYGSSSTFDHGSNSSLESALRAPPHERSRLTPLALLALGVRSPPDFSLSIGRALGLVQATLPEAGSGQVDRSSQQTHEHVMEALRLLLDTGADVNASSTIFRKTFRPLELFLQPSVDLYYAPLMPRGGRDSAVLRCMDLERAGELVLSACWELMARGAELDASFRCSVAWNLNHMDWMFLHDDSLRQQFLHLAIFLGLFPPCCVTGPVTCLCNTRARPNPEGASSSSGGQRDARASQSFFVGGEFPVGSFPAQSRSSAAASVPSSHPEVGLSERATTSTASRPADVSDVVLAVFSGVGSGTITDSIPSTSLSAVGSHRESGVQTEEQATTTDTADTVQQQVAASSAATPGLPQETVFQQQQQQQHQLHQPGCPAFDSPARCYQTQLWLWAAEERQQRVMERCVADIVRLSVSPRALLLLLRFLSFPDLRMMAALTETKCREWRADTGSVERLREALWQAHTRSLKHSAKVVILIAARWRYRALQALPIPESLKRYLVDAWC